MSTRVGTPVRLSNPWPLRSSRGPDPIPPSPSFATLIQLFFDCRNALLDLLPRRRCGRRLRRERHQRTGLEEWDQEGTPHPGTRLKPRFSSSEVHCTSGSKCERLLFDRPASCDLEFWEWRTGESGHPSTVPSVDEDRPQKLNIPLRLR